MDYEQIGYKFGQAVLPIIILTLGIILGRNLWKKHKSDKITKT